MSGTIDTERSEIIEVAKIMHANTAPDVHPADLRKALGCGWIYEDRMFQAHQVTKMFLEEQAEEEHEY